MNDIKIRRATLKDASLLAELGAQAFYQAFAHQNTPENMAAYLAEAFAPQKLAGELSLPGSIFFIAETGSEPVGYARLLDQSIENGLEARHPIELVRLYVLQKWIGKGIGARLMETCIQEARTLGCDVIWLGVWKKNGSSIQFYKNFGYQEFGTHTFQLGSEAQEDWLMQLRLCA